MYKYIENAKMVTSMIRHKKIKDLSSSMLSIRPVAGIDLDPINIYEFY